MTRNHHPGAAGFRPFPLLGNPHLQTILGNLLPVPRFDHPFEVRRLALPDGDALLLYDSVPPAWRPGLPIVLALHGLGGCHASGSSVRLARFLLPHGYRVVRLDMRGAGPGIRHARRFYHAGLSADIRAVLAELHRWSPAAPLVVCGFSLGGNIALKTAGEAGEFPTPMLAGVAAVNPPVDLRSCSELLDRPGNWLYNRYYARNMVAHVRRHEQIFPDVERAVFPPKLTLRQFDELFMAPRGGFRDALDYYARSSALPLLGRITVPALILTARDDPFVDAGPILSLPASATIETHITSQGGHLGFVGRDGLGGFRWAEKYVAAWVRRKFPCPG